MRTHWGASSLKATVADHELSSQLSHYHYSRLVTTAIDILFKEKLSLEFAADVARLNSVACAPGLAISSFRQSRPSSWKKYAHQP